MLRRIKIPFIGWLLLTSILFAPMVVEFRYDCGCTQGAANLTQEQKDDAAIQKTIEFNKAIADGQIDVSGGWWVLCYVLYIAFFVIRLITGLIQMDDDIYPLVWNLKFLDTKEGSYFYRINKKKKYLEVFKQNILTYQKYDSMSIYSSNKTTADITDFLNRTASNIDRENLSYLSEEMSTCKRFKTKE